MWVSQKNFWPDLEISKAFAIVLEVFSRFRVILRLKVCRTWSQSENRVSHFTVT